MYIYIYFNYLCNISNAILKGYYYEVVKKVLKLYWKRHPLPTKLSIDPPLVAVSCGLLV